MLCAFFFKHILVSSLVTVFLRKNLVFIKGPLGELFLLVPLNILIERTMFGLRVSGSIESKAIVLTVSKLLYQKIRGVELGFFEVFTIKGIGWRVTSSSSTLTFALGFSHPVVYPLWPGIEGVVLDKQKFKLFSLDLGLLRQAAAGVCKLRSVDVYKGKGIQSQLKGTFKLKVSSKSKS